jgi:hypothetical protein
MARTEYRSSGSSEVKGHEFTEPKWHLRLSVGSA